MKNVALITGASTGIGKEFAYIHAEKGGDLIIVARSKNKLEALKAELELKFSVKVVVITKDLGIAESPKQIYEEVKQAGIEINYLINNAGFGSLGRFHELSLENQLSMINLNISALTALSHLFVVDFVKRGSGKILNVSSTASLMPGPLQAVYFATKAYVTSFSNALAEEFRGTGVSVTALLPGATETEFGQISGMDKTVLFDKTASARSVAEDGYNGMLADKLDVISGLTFSQKLMTSMIPLTPKKILLKQVKQMQEVKKS